MTLLKGAGLEADSKSILNDSERPTHQVQMLHDSLGHKQLKTLSARGVLKSALL